MEEYERRMTALRQGDYLPPVDDLYDFNADLKAVSNAHKKKTIEQDSYMTKEGLMELRKVQQERNEVCASVIAHFSESTCLIIDWPNEIAWHGCQAELWCSDGYCI